VGRRAPRQVKVWSSTGRG